MAISSLNDANENLLRGVLAREAVALSAGRRMPLDLPHLLAELGIGLTSAHWSGPRAAHGRLRRLGRSWDILINETTTPARQRFTIAHEVGHYVIEARVGFRPGTTREYWIVEDLCQAFAAALLSPPTVVAACISPRPDNPEGIFGAWAHLMVATDLSLEATARRIVEAINTPTALAAVDLVVDGPQRAVGAAGTLRWLHANHSWIKAGRGQKIRPGHPLWPAVSDAREAVIGARMTVLLDDGQSVSVERREPTLALVAAYLTA